MKRILFFVFVIGTTVIMLSSCQKNEQATLQPATKSAQTATPNQANASNSNGYDGHSIYQIELSANISGSQGGGLWLWIGLHSDGTGDYSGADCGHGGGGATSDKGDVTWHLTGVNNTLIEIDGVVLNGLGGFPTT